MTMSFTVLDRFLSRCVSQKKFPGCVCWIGNDRRTLFFESYGHAQIIPEKIKMKKNMIFDLASITKPIATALSIMLLYEKKELNVASKVEHFLASCKNKPNGKKTIHELLIHKTGLPAWFPLYLLPEEKRLSFLAETNTGMNRVVYSCLGYILLGKIVERITGLALNKYCHRMIYNRLGLKNTLFKAVKKKNVVATEDGNAHEKRLASTYGDISTVPWRDYLIKGEVHDGNCFYAFHGVSGNAGLFSNVADLITIMRAYLRGEIVRLSTVRLMTKTYTRGKEKRGLGWVIDPYPGVLSSTTFSHTGFTGTMLLVEPKKNLIIMLLTNAVHPKVKLGAMTKIRETVVSITNRIAGTQSNPE